MQKVNHAPRTPRKLRSHLLADKLRDARILSGLNQREIAERLHKPQSYISRCESGMRRIDVFELQDFARAYNRPLDFFVGTNSDAREIIASESGDE